MIAPRRSYSTIQVAKRLGVSLQTVQRWVDAGHLVAWKTPGGHRRIEAGSAERMIRASGPELVSADEAGLRGGAPQAAWLAVVADDDPIDRELLARLVRRALPGLPVEMAEDRFQALLLIGRLDPKVIVTDLQMPHMNGAEMIRRLPGAGDGAARTIIAVSAHSLEHVATLGPLPAAVRFFPKPVDEEAFMAALQPAARLAAAR